MHLYPLIYYLFHFILQFHYQNIKPNQKYFLLFFFVFLLTFVVIPSLFHSTIYYAKVQPLDSILRFDSTSSQVPYRQLGQNRQFGCPIVRETLMTKPQSKDTQGDKGQYENNVQLVQWIFSVYKSANNRYMETCLVQWISSEIKLRKSHCTGCNPTPYASTYYIIRTNKGNGNIDENPDTNAHRH